MRGAPHRSLQIELVDLLETRRWPAPTTSLRFRHLSDGFPEPLREDDRRPLQHRAGPHRAAGGGRPAVTEHHESTIEQFEDALAAEWRKKVRFELTLFVSGASELAARAIANAERCATRSWMAMPDSGHRRPRESRCTAGERVSCDSHPGAKLAVARAERWWAICPRPTASSSRSSCREFQRTDRRHAMLREFPPEGGLGGANTASDHAKPPARDTDHVSASR